MTLPRLNDHPTVESRQRLLGTSAGIPSVSFAKSEGSVTPGVAKAVSFTVFGAPRTKKTSNQLARHKGKIVVLPSMAWRKWVKAATVEPRIALLPDQPYSCRALFYRDIANGDAVGFYQGLADGLEHWKILSNDKWIVDWDGSRMLKDSKRPRVEVTLTPVSA